MTQVSVKVGNQRLLKLAAFLRTVPRRRFDYGTWTGYDWQGAQNLSCGTSACALGWAATMPAFRRLGLYLSTDAITYGSPRLKGSSAGAISSAMKLFGITEGEADHLFIPSWNESQDFNEDDATPKYVARKIEKFVKERSEQ